MIKTVMISFVVIILLGCTRKNTVHFYSLDKSQSITIIDIGDFRYIIDGEHKEIPRSNYVKLDIQNIPPLGSEIVLCWQNERYKWRVVVPRANIVEVELDTLKYSVITEYPKNKDGHNTTLKFVNDGCSMFDYHRMELILDNGTIVKTSIW
jgi:hypothetical protein